MTKGSSSLAVLKHDTSHKRVRKWFPDLLQAPGPLTSELYFSIDSPAAPVGPEADTDRSHELHRAHLRTGRLRELCALLAGVERSGRI